MQIFALALMLPRSSLSSKLVVDFVVSLPALVAGTALGIAMFRNVNELAFRARKRISHRLGLLLWTSGSKSGAEVASAASA